MGGMKKVYLQELLNHTLEQREALEGEELEIFQYLMDQKSELMTKLDELNKGLESPWNSEEKKLLEEISKVDQGNGVEFMRQLEIVKAKLKQLRQNKAGSDLYSNPYDLSVEEGMFFDKKEIKK